VRIVDRKSGPVEQTKATLVQARTLEYLDRLGLADQAMEQGMPITRVEVYEKRRAAGELPLLNRALRDEHVSRVRSHWNSPKPNEFW
jgi:2-polyprenyl-6-methoxyphenol hydroxylase-like FAD-dependent oxidoreductase